MEVEELIRRAWEAVEKASVPKALQKAAFKEAVDFLRSANAEPPSGDSILGGKAVYDPDSPSVRDKAPPRPT
jgi:hypothetical protein